MSNCYRFAKSVPHFQMPQAMVPKLNYLRVEELRLLIFLQSEFQRTSKSEIIMQAEAITKATSIHPSNLGRTRDSLVSQGLLLFKKKGKAFTYICCDPSDRSPVPDGSTGGGHLNFDDASAVMLRMYFEPHLNQCSPTENGLTGCCPFPSHSDTKPSFSVELKDGGGGRWICFGCGKSGKLIDFEVYLSENSSGVTIDRTEAYRRVSERLRGLGLTETVKGAQSDIVYSYCDWTGEIVFEVVRPGGMKEGMYRRRPDPDRPGKYINNTKGCSNVLYRLPEISEAGTVIFTEGEPDVENLRKLNLHDVTGQIVAVTTVAGGVNGWLPEHAARLKGKYVILIGDNDADGTGLRFMEKIKLALADTAKSLVHVELPSEFKDISHYLETHTADDFVGLVGDEWLDPPVRI